MHQTPEMMNGQAIRGIVSAKIDFNELSNPTSTCQFYKCRIIYFTIRLIARYQPNIYHRNKVVLPFGADPVQISLSLSAGSGRNGRTSKVAARNPAPENTFQNN